MRYLLLLLLMALAVPSCMNEQEEPQVAIETAVSVILLTDDSLSDLFIRPDTGTLRKFLSPFLVHGLELSAVAVKNNSYKQTVYYSGLLQVKTLPGSDNFIKNRRNKEENQIRLAQAYQLLTPVLDTLQRKYVMAPRCDSSDVNNALKWVNIAAQNAVNKSNKVIVVLASDLVQDLIPYVQETAQPIHLPPGIQLVIIGQHPTVDFEQLFPGQRPMVLPSFQHLQRAF
ncbi:MAG: hypothetical protein JNN28_02495 [Saprospiraceae bacterium]|nr:hypothetical protein [Saprospiraceae bacterium]